MDYFRTFMVPVKKCMRNPNHYNQRIFNQQSIQEVIVGGFTRTPKVHAMIQEVFNGSLLESEC